MFLSPWEIVDMLLMSAIIGFFAMDFLKAMERGTRAEDVLDRYLKTKGDSWGYFRWAVLLAAPPIILHEMAHKVSALSFGMDATFHAACSTAFGLSGLFDFTCLMQLGAIVLKQIGFPLIIFIPGYVQWFGTPTYLQQAIIAFAGPAMHLLLWIGAALLMRERRFVRKLSERGRISLYFTKQLNMILFIWNMIPIPGFDGSHVFFSLFKAFF